LGAFANRGRIVPELDDESVRELFVFRQRYRMIYRVLAHEVQILAFIHGARDLLEALEER
jgi:toxin ParE1/3/4